MVDCNQFLKVIILRLDMDRILLQIDFEFQFVRFFLKFLDPLLLFLISIVVIFCEFGRFTTCILFRCIRIRSVRPFQPPVNSYTSRVCCSDVSFTHYHFLISDVVGVSNVQQSCQLTTLYRRKTLAKITNKQTS